MSTHRKNTLVVDFSVLPRRPKLDQIEEFLKDDVKIDLADVKNIQIHNIKNCVYIEMTDAGLAPRLQKQHHLKHYYIHEGKKYYIPVYVDGPTTTVKIHDISPQMSNDIIVRHMQQYGKVISIENDVWKNFFPGILNGVRIVRMRLEKTLPSRIVVNGESTYVTYPKINAQSSSKPTLLSSSAEEQNRIGDKQCKIVDHPSIATRADTSDDDNDDDDDDGGGEGDDNRINDTDEHETETVEAEGEPETAKRRLSTETENGRREESVAKRSCNEEAQKAELGWTVYQTRSKKKQVMQIE
ncbi:uncharacterized protein LOC134284680 [Aedes albopictus]|uniref:Translation elongation factor ef-1 alpha/tu n=1 Tax=Aedes albopictus TaxID=7160 RepID=A0ABM1XMS7_AEDAL